MSAGGPHKPHTDAVMLFWWAVIMALSLVMLAVFFLIVSIAGVVYR